MANKISFGLIGIGILLLQNNNDNNKNDKNDYNIKHYYDYYNMVKY